MYSLQTIHQRLVSNLLHFTVLETLDFSLRISGIIRVFGYPLCQHRLVLLEFVGIEYVDTASIPRSGSQQIPFHGEKAIGHHRDIGQRLVENETLLDRIEDVDAVGRTTVITLFPRPKQYILVPIAIDIGQND
nr:hypothetical protein [Xanthomonas citri]